MSNPEEVLYYWFPEEDIRVERETFLRRMQWWFAGGPEVDREITGRSYFHARRARVPENRDTGQHA